MESSSSFISFNTAAGNVLSLGATGSGYLILCFTSSTTKLPLPPACTLAGFIKGETPPNTSCVTPGDKATCELRKTCAPCVNTVTLLTLDLTAFSTDASV